jgi:primosomal protein N' (replication factor Y)
MYSKTCAWKTRKIQKRPFKLKEFFDQGDLISVLTTQPIDRFLDYKAPEGGCFLGAFVEVPLGPRKVMGVVWGEGTGDFDESKIRSVLRVLDVAPLRDELKSFLQKAADYTLTPLSSMLRLATRAPGLGDPPSMRVVYQLADKPVDKLTDARRRVLDVIREYGGAPFTLKELADLAGVSTSVVKGLAKIGTLVEIQTPKDMPFMTLDPTLRGKRLTDAQSKARDILLTQMKSATFNTTLLRGVTGSGKTEVYLEAVANCLAAGQQALVLLPEIALTSEFILRVEDRFGAKPAEWHSGVTMTERRRTWKMAAQGGLQLVVGARSSLFLPFRSLGLIVVDEEHDSSYKQEDGVLYNARDMAVLRASIAGAKIILSSATPSLESWSNGQSGKYTKIELTERVGVARMPQLSAIDMRAQSLPSNRWISSVLEDAIAERITKGEQSLLFLNRRGYAPITLCRACGEQIGCQNCDARLVEHRFQKRLMCHQCGDSWPIPEACPSCGKADSLAVVGPGVERLAEEAKSLFPAVNVVTLSSDMFSSSRAMKQQIQSVAAGEGEIIVGTQLVAKGHNFPNLTLVGVIDTDIGLQGSDLRAAERTFQLVRQVAGRAGRVEKPGLALIQTHQPDHPVIKAILSGDDIGFWTAEAAARQLAGAPPFGRLAGILITASNAEDAFRVGNELARHGAPLLQIGAKIYGPAVAPIARVRGRYRVRMLIKAEKSAPLQKAIQEWLCPLKVPSDVRLSVDIDPQSFL